MSSSRFSEPQDAAFRALNDSLSFDWRLGPYDVQQSRAHAAMLAAQGIISAAERDELHRALEQVEGEMADGRWAVVERSFWWGRVLGSEIGHRSSVIGHQP